MTGTIARVTVFYFSQYVKAPTRVTSWVYEFCKFYFSMPYHYTLVSQNILLIFNKHIYTLYIVVLVIYSFNLANNHATRMAFSCLHHTQVICTFSAFPGMALVTALE